MTTVKTKSGSEIKPEDLDALTKEVEKGYDLTKAKRVRRGRPSLTGSGSSPRVQVRLDAGLNKALRSTARKEKRSVSEVARTALREYVERAK